MFYTNEELLAIRREFADLIHDTERYIGGIAQFGYDQLPVDRDQRYGYPAKDDYRAFRYWTVRDPVDLSTIEPLTLGDGAIEIRDVEAITGARRPSARSRLHGRVREQGVSVNFVHKDKGYTWATVNTAGETSCDARRLPSWRLSEEAIITNQALAHERGSHQPHVDYADTYTGALAITGFVTACLERVGVHPNTSAFAGLTHAWQEISDTAAGHGYPSVPFDVVQEAGLMDFLPPRPEAG